MSWKGTSLLLLKSMMKIQSHQVETITFKKDFNNQLSLNHPSLRRRTTTSQKLTILLVISRPPIVLVPQRPQRKPTAYTHIPSLTPVLAQPQSTLTLNCCHFCQLPRIGQVLPSILLSISHSAMKSQLGILQPPVHHTSPKRNQMTISCILASAITKTGTKNNNQCQLMTPQPKMYPTILLLTKTNPKQC